MSKKNVTVLLISFFVFVMISSVSRGQGTSHPWIKERIQKGETVYGIFVIEMFTPGWGTLLDKTGYDFAIFDMEHGSLFLPDMVKILPSFVHSRSAALLRIPEIRREYFQYPLDLGFSGIVVPMVSTAEQARQCVSYMRFAPEGRRGLGGSGFSNKMKNGVPTKSDSENALLVIMIENAEGVKNLDEILKVEGIDLILIGNSDLSQSLQCPNNLRQGVLHDTMTTIFKKATAAGVACGGVMSDANAITDFAKSGMRFVAVTSDLGALYGGLGRSKMNLPKK